MKTKIKNWAVLCMIACSVIFAACDDDKDFSYKGNLDLNLLSIKQARDLWDGTKCNVTTSIKQPLVGEEQKVDEFNYRLSLTLYQNRQATKGCHCRLGNSVRFFE